MHTHVRSVVTLFLTHHQNQYEKRAYAERVRILNLFAEYIGDRPITDCTPADVLTFVTERKQWKSGWTKRLSNQAIQRCFNWAAKLKLVKENPFTGVTFPEGEPRRAMTTAEFHSLIKATDTCFRPCLWFLWWTGCRPGELSSMTWKDVDFERGIITLKHHKTAKKTKKPRMIPLPDHALKMLRVQQRRYGTEGFVFTNRSNRPWNRSSLSLRMQRLRERIGLPRDCYLYSLRHSYGTNAILAGVPVLMVAKCMGHSGTGTTIKHYVHIDHEYEALRGAANFKRPAAKAN